MDQNGATRALVETFRSLINLIDHIDAMRASMERVEAYILTLVVLISTTLLGLLVALLLFTLSRVCRVGIVGAPPTGGMSGSLLATPRAVGGGGGSDYSSPGHTRVRYPTNSGIRKDTMADESGQNTTITDLGPAPMSTPTLSRQSTFNPRKNSQRAKMLSHQLTLSATSPTGESPKTQLGYYTSSVSNTEHKL